MTERPPHRERAISWLISPNIALIEDSVQARHIRMKQTLLTCTHSYILYAWINGTRKHTFLTNTLIHFAVVTLALCFSFCPSVINRSLLLWTTKISYATNQKNLCRCIIWLHYHANNTVSATRGEQLVQLPVQMWPVLTPPCLSASIQRGQLCTISLVSSHYAICLLLVHA